jgi:hypothetical protein
MIDHILNLHGGPKARRAAAKPTATTASTRFRGGQEQPVVVAVIQGPVAAEMALEALQEAGIPAMLRRNPVGTIYGMSLGVWGETPVIVPAALQDQAHEILVGMGLVDDE